MKKVPLIISIIFFITFFILIIFPGLTIKNRQGITIDYGIYQESFMDSKPVQFSFISNFSHLQALSVGIKNPGLQNNSHILFTITSPSEEQTVSFNGNNLGDESSVYLKFPPFSDPPNTKYDVLITTDNNYHAGLYQVMDQNHQTIFKSYYLQSDFLNNLTTNLHRQLMLIQQRSSIHNLFYLFSVLILIGLIIV